MGSSMVALFMLATADVVSFQSKNPDFLLKNPDFLLKNPEFLLENVEFIIKQESNRVAVRSWAISRRVQRWVCQ